jgi:hypothetical protein
LSAALGESSLGSEPSPGAFARAPHGKSFSLSPRERAGVRGSQTCTGHETWLSAKTSTAQTSLPPSWWNPSSASAFAPGSRSAAQRGVALVITLIMLSIITVITITILAIVRRDRASVTQAATLTDAHLAADAALERAKAEMMAQILSSTNLMAFDLTVSRSLASNVADLFIDPRVPVFVDTNRGIFSGPLDPRFFLDLNRDGSFEDSFLSNGVPGLVGDPQWIGQLEKPWRKHDGNNRFTTRYAFCVVPSGKALDANWIHNAASDKAPALKPSFGYFRNQGFGPWEINLAAFLADLNPTVWGQSQYDYGDSTGALIPKSGGYAFADAKDLLLYRYAGLDMTKLPSIFQLYGTNGTYAFASDLIDGYATAPSAMGLLYPTADADNPNNPWPGADSVRHYFSHQDFLSPAKTSSNFVYRLSQTNGTDSYAFYRLLSQLGTDSAPLDLTNKIQLNYTSVASPDKPTNFVAWDSTPESSASFFVKVADRLLHQQFRGFNPGWNVTPAYTNISSITNIPVSPTNFYTPAVHRLLQVAANIFDATRSNIYPSVFRPLFTSNAAGVFITSFTNDNRRSTLDTWLTTNRQYGIPLVIGAKKGFPNFNEYTLQTDVQVTRKLLFVRADTNSAPNQTNQMYLLGISNLFAVEAWNSYQAPYPRALQLDISDVSTVRLTNQAGLSFTLPLTLVATSTNLPPNAWLGKQFRLPIYVTTNLMVPSVYRFTTRSFEPVNDRNPFEKGFPLPDWTLTISNQFLYVLSENDKILDFVLSTDFNSDLAIDDTLMKSGQQLGASGTMENAMVSRMWDTNRINGSTDDLAPTLGIRNQIAVCLGMLQVGDEIWRAYSNDPAQGQDKNKSIRTCQAFFQMGATQYPTDDVAMNSLEMQAPFCPTRKLIRTVTWQADDPLVHYHHGDLLMDPNSINEFIVPPTAPVPTNMTLATLGRVNKRFSPWGGNPEVNSDPVNPTDPNAYNMAIKDPGVRSSDDWDFPNGKFPSIGWLGRVHRGTPWQTIYFKSSVQEALEETWRLQSAEYRYAPGYWYRAHPTNDWALADIFTTATDLNSTRGLLSINQANLPAWSAVLSGVVVLRNAKPDAKLLATYSTNRAIELKEEFIVPAANDTNTPPLLVRFVNGLNGYRTDPANFNKVSHGGFTNLAQLFQVPEFTVHSPWLNTASQYQQRLGLTDAAYERLPMQILSLVKPGDPRFVVYAYGQALRPARDSIDTSRGNLCTNYQVTAEVATRVVIRVEGTPDRPRPVIESFNILPPD